MSRLARRSLSSRAFSIAVAVSCAMARTSDTSNSPKLRGDAVKSWIVPIGRF